MAYPCFRCKGTKKSVNVQINLHNSKKNSTFAALFYLLIMKKVLSIGLMTIVALMSLVSCDKEKELDAAVVWVDLGLPSGLLWADRNIGATSETGSKRGYYYAWGETSPKRAYYWYNYRYAQDSLLTKYCNDRQSGYRGFIDSLTVLEPSDDVATVRFGSGTRIPTVEEWQELLNYTTTEYVYSASSVKFTGRNGNSILITYSGGYMDGTRESLSGWDGCGYYASSSLCLEDPLYSYALALSGGNYFFGYNTDGSWKTMAIIWQSRRLGTYVRPVRDAK